MSIWIKYTKYEFIRPKQISIADYNQLRNNYPGFIDTITMADKELFLKNYKFKIYFGPIILLLFLFTWEKIMEIGRDWIVIICIFLAIIGVKCFGYIFSALSIWDNVQNKKRFYKNIKGLVDKSSDYNEFQQRLITWNKNQDLGFTGRMTYKILMSLRGKSGQEL